MTKKKPSNDTGAALIRAAARMRDACNGLSFGEPVTHVYSPLEYAWEAHRLYLERWGNGGKRILFMGMNPGPWGMAQVGVPFGEVNVARDWLGISAEIGKPQHEHPKRRIEGFACARSEVSGRRLWGYFAECFPDPAAFFADHLVINYCPLVFMEASGRNRTPDKLPAAEQKPLLEICDRHLRDVVKILSPEWVIGVGRYARDRAEAVLDGVTIGQILHPSPASPAANRDWAGAAAKQLRALGIWQH